MTKTSTKIEKFIEKTFQENKEVSEIIIQNNKPIVFISQDNQFKIYKKKIFFEVDDIIEFSLNQNQVISNINPSIGGIINNTTRWHLIMAPITVDLYCLQFRRVNFDQFCLSTLLQEETKNYLNKQLPSKRGCVFFGETSSGKSTLLYSMITHYHSFQRVIILERFAEISPANPFWTNLNCHQNSLSLNNDFDYDYLLKQTQRLRPDVLVIGEITSFNNDIFHQLTHSGFQKLYLTVHGSNLNDITTKLDITRTELMESFLVFKTRRNRKISCLNETDELNFGTS